MLKMNMILHQKSKKNGCSRNFCQTGGRMIKKWKSYACCPKLLVKSASLPTIPAMIREIRVRHNVTNALWLFFDIHGLHLVIQSLPIDAADEAAAMV